MALKDVVVGLLKDNPQGLSIKEISVKTKVDRTTVRVVLEGLLGEKKIDRRIVGNTKLHYWRF
jgi:predicted transcriptional regulator